MCSIPSHLLFIDNYVNSPKFHRKLFTSVRAVCYNEVDHMCVVNHHRGNALKRCLLVYEASRLKQMQHHVAVSGLVKVMKHKIILLHNHDNTWTPADLLEVAEDNRLVMEALRSRGHEVTDVKVYHSVEQALREKTAQPARMDRVQLVRGLCRSPVGLRRGGG